MLFRLLVIYSAVKTHRSRLPAFSSQQILARLSDYVLFHVFPELTAVSASKKVVEMAQRQRKGGKLKAGVENPRQNLDVLEECVENESIVETVETE